MAWLLGGVAEPVSGNSVDDILICRAPVRLPQGWRAFDNARIVEQADMTRIQVIKGGWWMVRLSEATKDVLSCDKPGGGAPNLRSPDFRMGQPMGAIPPYLAREANPVN